MTEKIIRPINVAWKFTINEEINKKKDSNIFKLIWNIADIRLPTRLLSSLMLLNNSSRDLFKICQFCNKYPLKIFSPIKYPILIENLFKYQTVIIDISELKKKIKITKSNFW